MAVDDAVEEFAVIEAFSEKLAQARDMRRGSLGEKLDGDRAGRHFHYDQVFRIDRAPGGSGYGGRRCRCLGD